MPTANAIQFLQPIMLYDATANGYHHISSVSMENIKDIIHIAGQGGETLSGEISNNFEQQCQQVFLNLEYALDACHLDWHNIAKVTILVVDHTPEKLKIIVDLMHHYFSRSHLPTSTLIPVPCLALTDMQIEIDALAYRFK